LQVLRVYFKRQLGLARTGKLVTSGALILALIRQHQERRDGRGRR